MKKAIKAIALLLSLIMLLSTLAACSKPLAENEGSDGSSENTDATTETNKNSSSEDEEIDNSAPDADISKFPENVFPIFDGKSYAIKVVCSDTANEAERSVATKLRTALKSKTKVSISGSTDYLKKGESYDASTYEILVGKTDHDESTGLYRSVPYSNYGIRIIGRKMVLYFATAAEGEELVSTLTSALKKNDDGMLWVANDLSTTKTSTLNVSIPKYPSSSLSTVDCTDNTTMVVAKNTNLTNFNTYCSELVSKNGFTEYSKRENIDGNYFRTYPKDNAMIYAYYSNARGQARIISGPIKDIPTKDTDSTPETVTPSLTLVTQNSDIEGGLALIYLLPNGKFIIIDGGHTLNDKLYKKLRELQPNSDKIIIAAWFLSHPHTDHQSALDDFLVKHSHDVDIESFFVNYPSANYVDNTTQEGTSGYGRSVSNIKALLTKHLGHSTKIVKPHTGQIYTFGKSTQVEIIWTIEDLMPTQLDRVNTLSTIIRVTVDGYSSMILADATDTSKESMLKMYGNHLKSDLVTLAHHGIWVTTPEMYTAISAKTLIWPANASTAKDYYKNHSSCRKVMDEALKHATDVYLVNANSNDVTISLPYKTKGNKSSFVNSTLK